MKSNKDNNSNIEIIASNIISQLLELYNKKTIPNKYFHELVFEQIKNENIDYKHKVLIKTISLIPYNLTISTNKRCIFVSYGE